MGRKGFSGKEVLKNKAGFTLIELMIALFIIMLAIGGYVGANAFIQKGAEEAFERTVAIQDASRVIERMRSEAQTGVFPGNVTAAFPHNGAVAGFANLTNEQVVVTYVNATADPLDATVTVNWVSYNQRNSSTALRTLITQR